MEIKKKEQTTGVRPRLGPCRLKNLAVFPDTIALPLNTVLYLLSDSKGRQNVCHITYLLTVSHCRLVSILESCPLVLNATRILKDYSIPHWFHPLFNFLSNILTKIFFLLLSRVCQKCPFDQERALWMRRRICWKRIHVRPGFRLGWA